MKRCSTICLAILLFGYLAILSSCGGGSTTSSNNTAATVTITGTLATTNLNIAKSLGVIKAADEPSDFKVMALSSALNSSGDDLDETMLEATVGADGSFVISNLPDGTTSLAILDVADDGHKLVGLVKFGDAGIINTASASAGDNLELGTLTYNGATGLATSSEDEGFADIADATPIAEDTVLDSFGSTESEAEGTETDTDGDGTEDAKDTDLDGDGIKDTLDRDADGDGVLNQVEGHSFSSCKYFDPYVFINNKIPIGSTSMSQFNLVVTANIKDAAAITPTSIRVTEPAYILSNTTVEGGMYCTGTERTFDGELFDNFAESSVFCGFIRSSGGDDDTFANYANSGDMYTFELTGTDGDGAAVTETCTTQLSYVLKDPPQTIQIDGADATNGVNVPGADNIIELTWTEPVGLPAGFTYRYDVTPFNDEGGVCARGEMKITSSIGTVPATSATIDLTDTSTNEDTKFPPSTWGCWEFDLTIQDASNDNSSRSVMKTCLNGVAFGSCQ